MTIGELIDYIIDNHTIMEASAYFGCSRKTIMNRLRDFRNDPSSNMILKEKLELALMRNSLRGQKNGGKVGRKTVIISDEEALQLKEKKENENLSYRDLESLTGISYSTIRYAIERVSSNTEDVTRGR